MGIGESQNCIKRRCPFTIWNEFPADREGLGGSSLEIPLAASRRLGSWRLSILGLGPAGPCAVGMHGQGRLGARPSGFSPAPRTAIAVPVNLNPKAKTEENHHDAKV